MSGRTSGGRRAVPGVWQRLPYGPTDGVRRERRQAREARRGGARLTLGGLGAASVLLALVAGRLGV